MCLLPSETTRVSPLLFTLSVALSFSLLATRILFIARRLLLRCALNRLTDVLKRVKLFVRGLIAVLPDITFLHWKPTSVRSTCMYNINKCQDDQYSGFSAETNHHANEYLGEGGGWENSYGANDDFRIAAWLLLTYCGFIIIRPACNATGNRHI